MADNEYQGRALHRPTTWRDEAPQPRQDPWADREPERRSFGPPSRRDYRDAARVYGEAGDGLGGYDPTYRREPFEQASYELGSWFGDHVSERHRLADLSHRGLGPEGYRRTDERISEDVHHHLTEDPGLDARFIQVVVADGEVTLSGKVPDRWSKHRAEHCVEDIGGVGHVQNNLRVDRDLPKPPAPLGENATLARQAKGEI